MNKVRDEKFKKRILNLAKEVLPQIVESAYENSEISDEDLLDYEKVHTKLKQIFSRGEKENHKFLWVIDHTKTLLEQARTFVKSENYDYAILFYQFFFEHSANQILYLKLKPIKYKNKKEKTSKEKTIIKGCSLNATLLLLPIFGYSNFEEKHLKTILDVNDARNAFVHYKWSGFTEEEQNDKDKNLKILTVSADKAAVYFKKYYSKISLKGNKSKIKRLYK